MKIPLNSNFFRTIKLLNSIWYPKLPGEIYLPKETEKLSIVLEMALSTSRRSVSSILTRTISTFTNSSSSSLSSRYRYALVLFQTQINIGPEPFTIPRRFKTSGSGYSPLNDPSPNWSNRPPKETILLDGCDYEHWLIVMEFSKDPKPSEEEMINSYVKTLASVVGRYPLILTYFSVYPLLNGFRLFVIF